MVSNEQTTDLDLPTTPSKSFEKVSSPLLLELSKETWEYLELKLWASFSKRLWTLVASILTLLGLLAAFGLNAFIQSKVDAAVSANTARISNYTTEIQSKSDLSLALEAIFFT